MCFFWSVLGGLEIPLCIDSMVSPTWWFGLGAGRETSPSFPHGSVFSRLVFCREKYVLGVGWWEVGRR